MSWFLRFVGVWTLVDAVFLFLAPRRWSRWWGSWLQILGNSSLTSRLVALLELAGAVYLIRQSLAEFDGEPFDHQDERRGSRRSSRRRDRKVRAAHHALSRAEIPVSDWPRLAVWASLLDADPPWAEVWPPIPNGSRGRSLRSGDPGEHRHLGLGHPCRLVPEHSSKSANRRGYRKRALPTELSRAIAGRYYPVVQEYLQKSPPIMRGVVERTLFGEGVTEPAMREMARSFVMVAFRPADVHAERQTGNAS